MNFWQTIDKPVIGVAPMDGVSDASFRFITAKHGGPDVSFTEFVNVAAASFAPHTLIRDLAYAEVERPVVAQIYGNTPDVFYRVAHIVCELGFDGLDINMGCPAKKVAATGCGAALILNPELARSIIRAARDGIRDWCDGQTLSELKIEPELIAKITTSNQGRSGLATPARREDIPLSIKTRLGIDRIVVEDWIQELLAEKPAVISLHGRTLKQGYKGSADWDAIARAAAIATKTETLILGNGDLLNMEHVYHRVRETGVDGVLLGRAAQGNPWIFRAKDRVKQALDSGVPPSFYETPIGLAERFRVIADHCEFFEKTGGMANFAAMRKHLVRYCMGFRGAAELRSQMCRVNNSRDVAQILNHYLWTARRYVDDSAITAYEKPGYDTGASLSDRY
jgi:tRNA-dihydrouridine synthase